MLLPMLGMGPGSWENSGEASTAVHDSHDQPGLRLTAPLTEREQVDTQVDWPTQLRKVPQLVSNE